MVSLLAEILEENLVSSFFPKVDDQKLALTST